MNVATLSLQETMAAKASGVQRIHIQSRAQWLEERRKDITASDVPSICGHGYRSALAVYAEKMGLVPAQPDNDILRKGRWLEPAAFEALGEERPNWEIRRAKVYLRDPSARLGATPDGVAIDPKRPGIGILQAKVVSLHAFKANWLDDPSDDPAHGACTVPIGYQLQTLTEAMLAGATWAAVVALVHNEWRASLRIVPIERHAAAEQMIRQRVAEFWADVDAGRQPAIDASRDSEIVKALFPKDDGTTLDLSGDNELPALLDERESVAAVIKSNEARKKEIDTDLRAKLGSHAYARVADGRIVSWKLQQRAAFSVPAGEHRVLRISKGRG
jgi:predicted phage-related endonuclease